ncbi:hypothetical protein DSO57_1014902 [Entomophthora muscae]|uniref:Uncharacterized protein n=1 Tax=Entomophthora muscae TaxID=34485 RepID=A0ACC2SID5_9FUNG|nr:hypothetical protein DSO57_1014902 [Entomophthora muscae]
MATVSSDTFLRDYFGAASVLNQVSAVSAGLILVILGVLAIHDAKMVNRISLRLTAGIALVDLMNHLNNVLHRTLSEGDLCVISGFWRVFGRQLYCFLNVSIALNLQLILLGGHRPKPSWEKYYWIFSLGIPLVMNLPPLALGMFGFNGERCYVRYVGHHQVLLTINISLVILFTLVYCTFISVLVMLRLRAKLAIVRNLSPNQDMDQHVQRQVEKSLKRLIFRISLYPFTCVISLFIYFVSTVWNVFFEENSTLMTVSMFSLSKPSQFQPNHQLSLVSLI